MEIILHVQGSRGDANGLFGLGLALAFLRVATKLYDSSTERRGRPKMTIMFLAPLSDLGME